MIKLSDSMRDALGTHGQPKANVPNPPLFISGCMRSGTTFLVDKLAGHPQLLKIGSELNEVWTEIGGAPCLKECTYRGAEHANPQFAYNMANYFFEFIRESKGLKRRAMRFTIKWKDNVQRVNYDWKNLVPMNKSPHLMNKIGYVNGLFPDSKILLIVRDVYAQCASLKRHLDNEYRRVGKRRFIPDDPKGCWSEWSSGGGAPEHACYPADISVLPKMWLRLNELALQEIQQLPKDQYKIISYETLIKEQSTTLNAVFDFLDLLPKHEKEARKVAGKQIDLINTTTKGDPLEKWKSHLTAKEIEAIDVVVTSESARYQAIMEAVQNAE